MRFLVLFTIVMFVFPRASAEPATQPASIQYHQETRVDPPLHLHTVTVDLTDPKLVVKVIRGADDPDAGGPWQTKLATVRAMAKREKLSAAVNASFFAPRESIEVLGKKNPYFTGNWATVTGWAMSDGELWGTQRSSVSLVVDSKGVVAIGRFSKLPPDVRQVVGSDEQLVTAGKNTAHTKDLAPRTAVGVDRTGKKLVMLVVDGRRPDYSVGMTGLQVGEELVKLGCWDALMLDGGGSSTMVMPDPDRPQRMKIMNRPSDGHDLPLDLSVERPVACAIGIANREDASTKP
jgi:uncharacterized protein YigE (DUF2233 family)